MPGSRNILGVSAYYHDAAAALVTDGNIIAAAQEERFTRRKNDSDFPRHAAAFCLQHAGLTMAQLDAVVFYDKPVLKFTRLLETYLAVAPGGWRTFPTVLSNWLGEKLDLRKAIRAELPGLRPDCDILFTGHHQSHAASAFYPSPFDEARYVLVIGAEKMTAVSGQAVTEALAAASYVKEEAAQGLTFPGIFGRIAQDYFARYGDHATTLARIAVKNHANGVHNPLAHLRKALEFEACNTVSAQNPLIAAPLRKTDCSLVSDGAAAVVLADRGWTCSSSPRWTRTGARSRPSTGATRARPRPRSARH